MGARFQTKQLRSYSFIKRKKSEFKSDLSELFLS